MDLSVAQLQAERANTPSSGVARPQGQISGWFDKPVPSNVSDPDAFRAARGFEAHFAKKLLTHLQGSTPLIGGDGPGAEIYNGMFTEMLGDEMAGEGALGIADLVYRDMMKNRGQDPYTDGSIRASQNTTQFPDAPMTRDMRALKALRAAPTLHKPSQSLQEMVDAAADKHGVDRKIVRQLIRAESGWNPYAVSSAGARGLMQLMPGTADSLGVRNSFNPTENVDGGVRYLKQMIDRYKGDLPLALAAYNAGPGAVDKYDGIPPFEETQTYVSRIIGWLKGEDVPDEDDEKDETLRLPEIPTPTAGADPLADLSRLPGTPESLLRVARDYMAHPGTTASTAKTDKEG